MKNIFLTGSVRTPIGRFGGTLADWSAADMGENDFRRTMPRFAGAALEEPLMACADDANKQASKGLTKAEVAQLFTLTGQIIENFQALRGAKPPRSRHRNLPQAAE